MAPHSEVFPEFRGFVQKSRGAFHVRDYPPVMQTSRSEQSLDWAHCFPHTHPHKEIFGKLPGDALQSLNTPSQVGIDVVQRHRQTGPTSTRRTASRLAPETVSAFLSATRVADSKKRAAESAPESAGARHLQASGIAPEDRQVAVMDMPRANETTSLRYPWHGMSVGGQAHGTLMPAEGVGISQALHLHFQQTQPGPYAPAATQPHMPAQHQGYEFANVPEFRNPRVSQREEASDGALSQRQEVHPFPNVYGSYAAEGAAWSQGNHQPQQPHFQGEQRRVRSRNDLTSRSPSLGASAGSPSLSLDSSSAPDITLTLPDRDSARSSRVGASATPLSSNAPGGEAEKAFMRQLQMQQGDPQEAATAASLHPLFVESLSGFEEPRRDMLADFCTMLTLAIRSIAHPLETLCADSGQPRGNVFAAANAMPPPADSRALGLKRKFSCEKSLDDEGRAVARPMRILDALPPGALNCQGQGPASAAGAAEADLFHSVRSTGCLASAHTGTAPSAVHLAKPGVEKHVSTLTRADDSLSDLSAQIEGFSFEAFQQTYLAAADVDSRMLGAASAAPDMTSGGAGIAAASAGTGGAGDAGTIQGHGDGAAKDGVCTWSPEDFLASQEDHQDVLFFLA